MQIIIKMNYCFQRKSKYLRIFIIKDLIEQKNQLKKVNYADLNFIVKSRGGETNYTELEDPMTFLNDIKKGKLKLEEAKYLQEGFNETPINIRKGSKS